METTRNVPRQSETAPQGRERDEADKQIAERLNAPPEQPTPTQEEADAIKEAARTGNQPQEQPPQLTASQAETAEQRRERERREREQQRDVKPGNNPTSYTTR